MFHSYLFFLIKKETKKSRLHKLLETITARYTIF
jgi:hypothetical protein